MVSSVSENGRPERNNDGLRRPTVKISVYFSRSTNGRLWLKVYCMCAPTKVVVNSVSSRSNPCSHNRCFGGAYTGGSEASKRGEPYCRAHSGRGNSRGSPPPALSIKSSGNTNRPYAGQSYC